MINNPIIKMDIFSLTKTKLANAKPMKGTPIKLDRFPKNTPKGAVCCMPKWLIKPINEVKPIIKIPIVAILTEISSH